MSVRTKRLARAAGVGILLAGWCVAPAAAAEETKGAVAPPPASEPEAGELPPSEERQQQAAQLFRDAEARYVAGDLAGAHQLMLSAYELSGRFELLFNLGQLERELKRCDDARRHYEAYLTHAPSGSRRDQAQRFQLELQHECPEPQMPRTPPPAALAPVPRESGFRPLQIAGWSSLGASLVAGVAATYFALDAARYEDRLEARMRAARNPEASSGGFTQADKALEADGQRAADWARGLTVGAVGLAAVGVSLLVLDAGRPRADTTAAVSVGWRAGAARLEYSGSF